MKIKDPDSLYIHIPFCDHICSYCDFTKILKNQKWEDLYISALIKEVDSYDIDKVSTIYVGGGTPSALSPHNLDKLLSHLRKFLRDDGEFTIECNPEGLDDEKIDIFHKHGINRISIGIQSSHDYRLEEMGRKHKYADAKMLIEKLQFRGFDNINIDLIYGLNGETNKELEEDLESFLSLKTQHISTYCLTIHQGTTFHNIGMKEEDEQITGAQYEQILKTLRKHGYERYEVSNFSTNGHESRHNLTYWKNERYYGIGLGASGYIGNKRYQNTRNLSKYLNGEIIDDVEELDEKSQYEYFLLTNLRLKEGFDLGRFESEFGSSIMNIKKNEIESMISDGLLQIIDNHLSATDRGMMILDRILVDLF